jgi:CBS domain-containing protein
MSSSSEPHHTRRVGDWMHAGVVSCPSDASLTEVARIMSDHRVHAVAVADLEHGRPWGTWHMVSDTALIEAIASGEQRTARQVAGTDAYTVSASESVHQAASLMVKHRVSHLVVTHEEGGYPIGIISTLDVAAAHAEGSVKRPRAR